MPVSVATMRRGQMDEVTAGAVRVDDSGSEESLLLQRVAAGDRVAFEALYRKFFPRLTRFLQRLLRRADAVEEVLNDAMLVVWRKAGTFNGQSKVSTWIFAIAYRKALKAMKRFDEPIESDEELYEETQPGPEQRLIQRQLCELLCEHIDRMSVEHRAVIELTIVHGYGYREIADIMDCPIDTVKTRMFHARRRLKRLLPEGAEEVR